MSSQPNISEQVSESPEPVPSNGTKRKRQGRAPHATLQNLVLRCLLDEPIISVSEFSRQFDADRSAISRAINSLKRLGLVEKEGKAYVLSDAGREEAERAQTQYERQITRQINPLLGIDMRALTRGFATPAPLSGWASGMLNTLADYKANDSFMKSVGNALKPTETLAAEAMRANAWHKNIMKDALNAHRAAFSGRALVAANVFPRALLQETLNGFRVEHNTVASALRIISEQRSEMIAGMNAAEFSSPAAMRSNLAESVLRHNALSTASLLQSQQTVTSVLQSLNLSLSIMNRKEWRELGIASTMNAFETKSWSQVNLSVSRMLNDMEGLRALKSSVTISREAVAMSRVACGLTRRYDFYLQEAVERLSVDPSLSGSALWDVRQPTFVTERYVRLAHDAIADSDVGDDLVSRQSEPTALEEVLYEATHQEQFMVLLDAASPRFVSMWKGATSVLVSNSDDRVRQAAHSGRELLNQILHLLAPNHVFSQEELAKGHNGQPTRKMRVRKIFGGHSKSAANLVDSMANSVEDLYQRACAVSHDPSDKLGGAELEVAATLMMIKGMVLYLLSVAREPGSI